jgi:thioredoxin reductase (NADPH)
VKTVEVLTRKGCHLCDVVLGELDVLRESLPFLVKLTYLENDPQKTELFGNDIPIVLVDGNEVCRHRLDRGALIDRLTESESKSPR